MAFRDGKLWMSEIEAEELGKAIGESFREKFPEFMKHMVADDQQETVIKSYVDSKIRELLRINATRSAPWEEPLAPADIFTIQKRLDIPAKEDEKTFQLQELNDDIYTLTKVLSKPVESLLSFKDFQARWTELAKALNISTAGQGLEWVPTGYSNQMIEFVELAAVVAQLFYHFPMPRKDYIYPLLLADGEAYKGGTDTSDDPSMFRASTPTTDDLTFSAVDIIANYPVYDTMMEDAMVPLLPNMKKSIARAVAKAEDNAIVNGQLTAALDTGYTLASYDARNLWDGLRYSCPSAMKQSGSAWDTTHGTGIFRALREDMGVFGVNSKDLAILCNTNMNGKFKSQYEVTTTDKINTTATIVSGEIKKFDGVDIVLSQHVMENVNASGVYDASTTDKTQFLLVYKGGFWMGDRRNFTMETERVPRKGITYLVATARKHWKPIHSLSSNNMVGWVYAVPK